MSDPSGPRDRFEVAAGTSEDGIPVGNSYDKYGSRNPIVRRIMRNFDRSLAELVRQAEPGSLHEIGCGEGYWSIRWAREGISVRGSDFSNRVIELARQNASSAGVPETPFEQRSIYELEPGRDSADLLVCCEVLEHLEAPRQALEALARTATRHVILSVPREPLWSAMNMARGKYWGDWGNTPGHVQRWSRGAFIELVSEYFDILTVLTPVPWTMLIGKQRDSSG